MPLNTTFVSADEGRYIRQIETRVNETQLSWSSALGLAEAAWQASGKHLIFSNIPDFRPGSIIRLYYHVCANSGAITTPAIAWRGFYLEPQISYNGGSTWQSLGASGAVTIMNTAPSQGSYSNSIWIDPQQSTEFGVQIRIWIHPYHIVPQASGAANFSYINFSEYWQKNLVSGSATVLGGVNGSQHASHIIVEELALVRGS